MIKPPTHSRLLGGRAPGVRKPPERRKEGGIELLSSVLLVRACTGLGTHKERKSTCVHLVLLVVILVVVCASLAALVSLRQQAEAMAAFLMMLAAINTCGGRLSLCVFPLLCLCACTGPCCLVRVATLCVR